MKDELLYMIFVVFALLLISSRQISTNSSHNDKSSEQISISDHSIKAVVPEFDFTWKNIESLCVLKFLNDTFRNATNIVYDNYLPFAVLKINQSKISCILHLKKKIFLPKLYNTPNSSDDYHHLS